MSPTEINSLDTLQMFSFGAIALKNHGWHPSVFVFACCEAMTESRIKHLRCGASGVCKEFHREQRNPMRMSQDKLFIVKVC